MRGTAEYVQIDEQSPSPLRKSGHFGVPEAESEIKVLDKQIDAQNVAITAAQKTVLNIHKASFQAQVKTCMTISARTRQVTEKVCTKNGQYYYLLHDQLCSLVRTFCALTEASRRYETDDYKRKTFIPADLWSGDNLGILVGVKLQKALLEMENGVCINSKIHAA